MNDEDRKVYKPAPTAGQMKCPKCHGHVMQASVKNPSVSVCAACGFAVKRVKLS